MHLDRPWVHATPLALWVLFSGCESPGARPACDPDGGACGSSTTPAFDTLPADEAAKIGALRLAQVTVPPDVSNRYADNPAAATFGQRLFFDPSFSGRLLEGDNDQASYASGVALGLKGDTGKVSCASCHVPEDGFSDTRSLRKQISLAAGWGRRRAPSLLDLAQSRVIMWDGHFDSLFSQLFGPIESEAEYNSSRLFAAEQMFRNHRAEYESIFGAMPPLDDGSRFPQLSAEQAGCDSARDDICVGIKRGAPGDGAEYDSMSAADQEAVTRVIVNMGKAIGAYERLLSCGTSRFDAWVAGDASALTAQEVRGARLFVGKAECASCHSGPYLSDEQFHNVGLRPTVVATVFIDDNDRGAGLGLTQRDARDVRIESAFSDGDDGRVAAIDRSALEGAFRTPRLRCINERPSFMHTAQLRTLMEVVNFFNRGGDPVGYPGTNELHPLNLSADERADLVAFMMALEGPGPDAQYLAAP
jgi:cytochrome c peroxidase